jgi:Ni,Fe-hydrogenase III large subunit
MSVPTELSDRPGATIDRAFAALSDAVPDAVATAGGDVTVVRIDGAHLTAAAAALAGVPGVRFADLFGTADPLTLRVIYALDSDAHYLVVEADAADGRLPELSTSTPAAFVEECELFEQFGLQPRDPGLLNRLAIPPHVGDFPRLGARDVLPANVHAPHTVGGHAFEFPVGPVRGAGLESLYYGLVTSGEEVVDVYLFTWHKHRGVEHRLRGLAPRDALFFVERAEGLSAVANSWAFAAAVENATGIAVSANGAASRAVYLELERLYNHAACLAALGQSTGLSVGQAQAEIALEQLLRVNAAVSGHRYLFGTVDLGGIQREPDLEALHRLLPSACDELRRVVDALLTTNSFLDRLEATGQLTTDEARSLGLVGPIARACDLPIDTRADHPRPPYTTVPCRSTSRSAGDALARLQVMRAEIDESVRLIGRLTDDDVELGRDDIEPAAPAGAGALGWAESSRGECLAWVELDGDGLIRRARLRPASVRNWRAFDDAVRAQNVFTDVPIIDASFWLTVAGRAL